MNLKRKHGDIDGEIREWAVRMMREKKIPLRQLSEELGVSTRSLHRWKRAAELEKNNEPLTKAERVELEELRGETQRLREELEIVKKFRAFSAKNER